MMPVPTPYPDINALLGLLLQRVQAVLGARFVGLYLHGSLAGGGFEPGRSDIDFLVVTAGELSMETQAALAAAHAQITASGLPWADHMEGSYIPLEDLRRYDPARASHPALRVDGSFAVDFHASDWIIQRHVAREKGIVLAGPPLKSLIDRVSPDALRQAAVGILLEWWEPMLRDSHLLRDNEYQAYAVLTMCRVLFTITNGEVASKPEAARWAHRTLDPRWRGLIERGTAWRHGMRMNALEEVLALIQYTVDYARHVRAVRQHGGGATEGSNIINA